MRYLTLGTKWVAHRVLALAVMVGGFVPALAWGQTADISVVKTGPAFVLAGTNLTYNITVANAGPDPATSLVLTDPLPAGSLFVSGSQDTGPAFSCTTPAVGTNGTVTCTIASFASGASASFTLVIYVPADAVSGGVGSNTATVAATETDPNLADNSSTASTTIVTVADVGVAKTGAATVTAGTNLSYSLTVSNSGPSDAQTVTLTDPLPAGTTFASGSQNTGPLFTCTTPPVGTGGTVTCTIATLAAGASATFTLDVAVPADAVLGATGSNTATISTATSDPNAANDSSTVTTTVATAADLSMLKTGPATVDAGSNATYSITVANAGPSDAQAVSFSDPLPPGTTFVSGSQNTGPAFTCATPPAGAGGTVSCSIATLAAGASADFTLVIGVPSNIPAGSVGLNTATVTSTTTDPNPGNESSTVATTVTTSADVSVAKTAAATVAAGSNLTYNVTVANAGPSDAVAVVLSDPLPAGTTFVSELQGTGPAFACTTPAVGANGTVTCGIPSLAAGASATFTVVVNIPAATANGVIEANTATVSSTTADASPGNNASTANTTVSTSADVSIVKTGPAGVTAGNDVTYAITVANAGPSDAQAVAFSDPLPAGTTFVSGTQNTGPAFTCAVPAVGSGGTASCNIAILAAGTSATFTLVANVPASTADATILANVTTISSATADANPANNTSTVNTTVAGLADVSITKSGPATVTPGTDITYSLTVANAGPNAASGVSFSDPLPAGLTFVSGAQNTGPAFTCTTPAVGATGTASCSLAGTLASGASATFTLVAHVPPAATGSVANTATVTATSPDPVAGNDSATSTATISASADLSVTKTGAATVNAGSNLTYTITVANAGPSDAQTVALSDPLPAFTTFVSAVQGTGPAFTCTTPAVGATGTVSCSIATLASGASASFTLVVAVSMATPNATILGNTATVTTATTDAVPGNNSATSTATVSAAVTSYTAASATGSGVITASFTGGGAGCTFATSQFIHVSGDAASPPAGSAPAGVFFPHGLFDFTTTGCTPGSTLSFTITYPSPVTGSQYWKYGPTSGNPAPHWYVLPATVAGNVVTFSITDGGLGDDDLAANGAVVDQGGPGLGGTSVPTLSEWMLALLAALILAAGVRAGRGGRPARD